MSRTDPGPFEVIQLRYPCDYCGAPPGVWCRTVSGAWVAYMHAARWWTVPDDVREAARDELLRTP